MLTIIFIFLVLALLGGGYGHMNGAPLSWSPLGLLLIVLVVLWLTGNLGRFHF